MDCSRWRKLVKDFDDQEWCEWVNVFFWYRLTWVVPEKGL